MNTTIVVELLGDGISKELSASLHSIAEVLPCRLEFEQIDLSLENRKARGAALYDEAEAAVRRRGVALKYPTATTEESPNAVLRARLQFAVIHRPVCTIPGIGNNFKQNLDIDIIRIATGGTYEDAGRRIGPDTAVSIRVIARGPAKHAARFAFKLAMLRETSVVSTSKYTIQKATDGLFEEVVGNVAKQYPTIPYRRELFDALLAGIIMRPDRYGVIVTPNEYGDFLSDAACGLIGSLGLGDSASYAFDDDSEITLAMFDPAGGTAPDIAGQNRCNPTAILLAFGMLLDHINRYDLGHALRLSLLGAIADGESTPDIGGKLTTTEFTQVIIDRLPGHLTASS
jgi:isocitrate dehydrogenase (NAD+)